MKKYFVVFIFLVSAFINLPAQIEIEKMPPTEDVMQSVEDKSGLKKHFKVALFLPFFKDGDDTTALKHAFALSSMDYLAGVKVALDSIEKIGNISIDFYVEDTQLDSSIVEGLLEREIYQDLDVLIGPIFQSGVEMAAAIIQKRSTIMYLPFEKDFKSKSLTNIISSQKNIPAFASYFSSYFLKNFSEKGKKYIMLYNSKEGKNGREAREMDSLIKLNLLAVEDTASIKIIDLAKKDNANLIAKLSKKDSYVFFINSKNSYYVNEALMQIKQLKSIAPEVYCFFEVLESEIPAYETWDTLSVKFFTKFFVDFEDEKTGVIRKKIIESYNQDPVEFTYKGYNDVLFLSQAFTEGKKWLEKSLNKDFPNEVSGFYYFKDERNGGVFNGYHAVWRYENLKLYRQY